MTQATKPTHAITANGIKNPFIFLQIFTTSCNFKEFLIYDMNKPTSEPEKILLSNLDKEYYRLEFIIDKDKEHIKKE